MTESNYMKYFKNTVVLILLLVLSGFITESVAQTRIPDEYRGNADWISRGVMDGNMIETNYRNTGETSRWQDVPQGVWPRSIGGSHLDGAAFMIVGIVTGEREKWPQFYPGKQDTSLAIVSINYRETGQRRSPSGDLWSAQPLNDFLNRNRLSPISGQFQRIPAISNDPNSWPDLWPDKLDNPDDPGWGGSWNGSFGKGVFNADLESFYVIDDLQNEGYQLNDDTGEPYSQYGIFYPSASDSTKGGLGLQTEVRLLQWANILAEDVMFMIYKVNNVGETNHDSLFFAQGNDYGLGEDENDDNAFFNNQLDIAYGWDSDGIGNAATGGTYELGYTGFAFLESPSANDGFDNDEDGIIDESRHSGPGRLIEGQENIRVEIEGNYDMTNFTRVYGPIEELDAYKAGRWWTGDENANWTSYDDANNNGQWDPGEFLNDDTGIDGLSPFDPNYSGPDFGEADGIPQVDERDFDRLDIPESDQIGLTGFDLGIRSNYEFTILAEDQFIWESIEENLFDEIGQNPDEVLNNNEPFIMFTSGPAKLLAGNSDYFSLAWIFGWGEDDFFKNRITVQNIYDANYNFAQPPITPTLTAIAGDGRVTLGWDSLSTASFDRFTQEFDFEGYRLYKGTNNLLSDARTITDVQGTPTFYKPLAQWDLDNGISGTVPVLENTAAYNLGDDTGLQYFYVDEDVTNGVTYYYALVAYDHGVRDSTGQLQIDPQENVFNFSVDQFFNLRGTSQNAEAVTPRARPAGFIESGTEDDLSSITQGVGTGSMGITIVDMNEVQFGDTYKVQFSDSLDAVFSPATNYYATESYDFINLTTNDTLLSNRSMEESSPKIEGLVLRFDNDEEIGYNLNRMGWVGNYGEENEQFNFDPRRVDGYETNWIANIEVNSSSNGVLTPDDFELRWSDEDVYYPPRFQTATYLRDSLNVIAVNLRTGDLTELLIVDRNENGEYDIADRLVIMEQLSAAVRVLRHDITFRTPSGENSTPPGEGDILRIANRKPFADGDFFQFTTSEATVDEELAQSELDNIKVVPNPYLAYSLYEPRVSSSLDGRGERTIKFINLPQECTIRIFNIRGETIQTLKHSTSTNDGDLNWDLRTKDGLDLAYGVYIYHVEAPGIGEKTGKFAIVK